jgi:hypothetical protein
MYIDLYLIGFAILVLGGQILVQVTVWILVGYYTAKKYLSPNYAWGSQIGLKTVTRFGGTVGACAHPFYYYIVFFTLLMMTSHGYVSYIPTALTDTERLWGLIIGNTLLLSFVLLYYGRKAYRHWQELQSM